METALAGVLFHIPHLLMVVQIIPPAGRDPRNSVPALGERIVFVRLIGSPLTEVRPGAQLTLAGQDLTASNGAYSVAITLDSVHLVTETVLVSSGLFGADVTIPSNTSPGTHQVCVSLLGENTCFNVLVCTNCQPKLGFIKGSPNIAESSVSIYKPPTSTATFTLVGDAFVDSELINIYLDNALFKGNVAVGNQGRFTTQLTMPASEPYGGHNVTVVGEAVRFGKVDRASATFSLAQFEDF